MTTELLINLALCLFALGGLAATVRLALAVSDAPEGREEVRLRSSDGPAVTRRAAVDDSGAATSRAA
jgi:hypothetical protein